MKMVDMKRDSNADQSCCAMPSVSEYPYGLRLCLEEQDLKKLGVETLPEVGSEMTVQCKVRVYRTSENETLDNGENRSLELQVMEMGLGSASGGSSDSGDAVEE